MKKQDNELQVLCTLFFFRGDLQHDKGLCVK